MLVIPSTLIPPHRCLVIDDAETTDLVAGMLRHVDTYTLTGVNDGSAALKHIASTEKRPDIIICALAIPDMDSMVFLRQLAEEQFTGGIILISSKEKRILRMATELAEAHHLNVLGALPKPFTAEGLLDMLSCFKGLKAIPPPFLPSLVTAEALREAIEHDQLIPYFQPKVTIATGEMVGVEALARWQHPELGLVPPALFIPVAEQNGMIGLITQKILSKSFEYATAWQEAGVTLPFAVNLSSFLLTDVSLPDRIKNELDRSGINPSHLTLEITESGLCDNMTACLEILLKLRLQGIHLSIDDFGTGYSSLAQLHKMPFDEVKIDRLFVDGVKKTGEARAIVRFAVGLGKELNLTTVAEGVEDLGDLEVCKELGCDIAQGYLTGRPVPGETFFPTAYRPQPHARQNKISLTC